jgi:hypothetical protein
LVITCTEGKRRMAAVRTNNLGADCFQENSSQERTLPKSISFLGDRSQERGAPGQSLLGAVAPRNRVFLGGTLLRLRPSSLTRVR